MRAFDADRVQGGIGLRIAVAGEQLAGDRFDLPDGALVLTDELHPVGPVCGDTASAGQRWLLKRAARST